MGALAAAALLREAQKLLIGDGRSAAAVELMGLLRLRAEVRCPTGPEPDLPAGDAAALAALEAVPA